jgi:hypothetical protein
VFTGERADEATGRMKTILDQQEIHDLITFARSTITTVLSKMNEVRVLEPELLPDSVINQSREIVSAFSRPPQNLAAGIDPDAVNKIYSLHSEIVSTYRVWIKSAGSRAADVGADSRE